jgi:hypothetical protein
MNVVNLLSVETKMVEISVRAEVLGTSAAKPFVTKAWNASKDYRKWHAWTPTLCSGTTILAARLIRLSHALLASSASMVPVTTVRVW